MTALAQERMRKAAPFKHKIFTLKSGTKAYKGGGACMELSSGTVVPGTSGSGLFFLGFFNETVDATAAAKAVNIDFLEEVQAEWVANDTVTPVVATDLCGLCYVLDDQTATGDSANSVMGRVWGVDATKGVLVEKSRAIGIDSLGVVQAEAAAGSFTSNDWAPTAITPGSVYAVPTTGAASTITLPAAAPDGSWATFIADGTANGHTVQYRDATGPTNLTTALTASKRHMVHVVKSGGDWFANAYVSP